MHHITLIKTMYKTMIFCSKWDKKTLQNLILNLLANKCFKFSPSIACRDEVKKYGPGGGGGWA